jgi:hypothetical protein
MELVSLFKKHDIFNIIIKSSEQLKIKLQRAISINNKAPITIISTTSSNVLVSVNSKIAIISDPTEKKQIQEATAQIGIRMLLSIVKLFPYEAKDIFEAIKESLETTSEMFGYNYTEINDLMKFEEFTELTQTLTGKKYADEIQKIHKTEIPSIIWTKKVPIDFLTNELKKRKWIKTQNEFSKLFGNSNSNLKVRWNMDYKYDLARLLYVLVKGDFIRPKKGVFSISEKFIVDFSGAKLRANSLKKISSKITRNQAKYAEIIEMLKQTVPCIFQKSAGNLYLTISK